MDVIYSHPGGRGWGQIELLAQLASDEFHGELTTVDAASGFTRAFLARGLVPPRRGGDATCLVIAPHPAHLAAILHAPTWRRRYKRVVGWVIDSFWVDRIPHIARGTSYYDHIFVTGAEDVAAWRSEVGENISALYWGTDALNMPCTLGEREVDLQRVGRQPPEWDDDADNLRAAKRLDLRYAGRPPFGGSDAASRHLADNAMAHSRFTLAFSNLQHAESYTHRSREYLTGRWLDSLAAGASVAGVSPKTQAARDLLWDGACLELPNTARQGGLDLVRRASAAWTPEIAATNRNNALERLDWRHRLEEIRAMLDIAAPRLRASLSEIDREVARNDR